MELKWISNGAQWSQNGAGGSKEGSERVIIDIRCMIIYIYIYIYIIELAKVQAEVAVAALKFERQQILKDLSGGRSQMQQLREAFERGRDRECQDRQLWLNKRPAESKF